MALPKLFTFGLMILCLIPKYAAGNNSCVTVIRGAGACPLTWIQWEDKCYKVTDSQLNWSEAKEECVKMGGVMVVPHSREEMDFLLSLHQRFWINCDDLQNEGTWRCGEGSTDVEYKNWRDGEPNDGETGEDCAAVPNEDGEWIDAGCNGRFNAICKQHVEPKLHL